jgi:hypothetical protein
MLHSRLDVQRRREHHVPHGATSVRPRRGAASAPCPLAEGSYISYNTDMTRHSQNSRTPRSNRRSQVSGAKSSRSEPVQSKDARSRSTRSKASGKARTSGRDGSNLGTGLAASALAEAPRRKSDAKERLARAESVVANNLPLGDLRELTIQAEQAAAAIEDGDPAGTSTLTGEALPSAAEMERIELANLRRAFAERKRVLRGALTVAQVAELLGKGRQYPHDRRKARSLLAVKDSGQWFFPRWQFDPEGPDGAIPGLPQVLRAMRGPISGLGQVRWFTTPKSLLNGRTPLEAMTEGDVDEVIVEAESIGAS